jgi:hypothetical protein
MIFAWMVFASFGMLMPRYCKAAWPKTTWFGKKIWFQVMLIDELMLCTSDVQLSRFGMFRAIIFDLLPHNCYVGGHF